jgi:phage-related protein
MLTTDSQAALKSTTDAVSGSMVKGSTDVKNWDTIQGTFNQKVDEAKAKLEVMAIKIGEKLMPSIEKLLEKMSKAVDWFEKHKIITDRLALALSIALKAAMLAVAVAAGILVGAFFVLGEAIHLLGDAFDYVYRWALKFWNFMKSQSEDFRKTLKKSWEDAEKDFGDLPKKFEQIVPEFEKIGEHIMKGVEKGIDGGWGNLMSKVASMADAVVTTAMSALWSHSPSRRMADQVGQWIPKGVAVGIDEHTPAATASVTRMANSLVKTAATGTAGIGVGVMSSFSLTGASAFGAGAGAAGGSVTIDMRGSQIMSDKDMDVFADRVGRRIATRILPAGGVRIRM